MRDVFDELICNGGRDGVQGARSRITKSKDAKTTQQKIMNTYQTRSQPAIQKTGAPSSVASQVSARRNEFAMGSAARISASSGRRPAGATSARRRPFSRHSVPLSGSKKRGSLARQFVTSPARRSASTLCSSSSGAAALRWRGTWARAGDKPLTALVGRRPTGPFARLVCRSSGWVDG